MYRPEDGFWAVADGMGGHAAGDVASAAVVHSLTHVSRNGCFADFVDTVESALLAVNQQLRDYSRAELGGRTVGSTVITMLLGQRTGVCLWAGDSRLYRLRKGQLTRVSRDHSAVQELVDAGVITPEQAQNHPNSNVITRAVGGNDVLYVDSAVFAPEPDDVYLLCSDGLYNEVPEDVIRRKLALDTSEAVAELIRLTLENGARDNVTVIVIKVAENA
jgi:protein phosphatase